MSKETKVIDLVIIGAGPAGLAASIYTSRSKINSLVLEEAIIGGQVRNTFSIENYPGFKKIQGAELSDLMYEQAIALGANIDEFDMIEKVTLTNEEKIIETNSYIYKPEVVIIATGATPRKLTIPSESKYAGKGIHYCAVCDGAMYEGKIVGVVGGGNSALEEALFLSKFAEKVLLIRRYDYFNGEKKMLDEVEVNPKIQILYNWDLVDVDGDNFMTSAKIKNTKTNEEKSIELDGVFGYIGTEPKTVLFEKYIDLSKSGYIITDEDMKTNVKGVYAVGDIRDKKYRQITTAVADGTIAALDAEKYIMARKEVRNYDRG